VDLLSAVFREVHFESAGYRWLEMRSPWRIDFDRPELRGVHIIASGFCELEFADGRVDELDTGDLVILPSGDRHALRSPGVGRMHGVSERQIADGPQQHDADTVILCGAFLIGDPSHPALRGLPRTVRVAGQDGQPAPWLAPLIDAIKAEATAGGPGSDLVMARLSDAMLLRALREHASTADRPGWLAGLQDPSVGAALDAMHADLAREWTLASLAQVAGLSRAAFAARFSERVGGPAMGYLSALRVQRARRLLADERMTVAAVAKQVGYQSEVGFAAAFKRETGVPPGRYRKGRAAANRDAPLR
jgi:AraC-like DNA-binding protein